ncbi:MAG TPA: AI-2E family transporter [Candidatus Saccharibacteria bacterium]|nr:AI-2E family transporter [Candidatus Saccharibacteria bacterium]
MKIRVDADTKTFVRFWSIPVLFALSAWMIFSAREALIILGTALFLALALSHPVKKLAAILPGKSRLGGTALAFVSLILIIGAVVWFVVPPIVQQSAKFAETLPGFYSQVNDQWHGLRDFIDENGLREQVNGMFENIKDQASGWAATASSNIVSGVGSLASFLFSTFLVIVLSFLMLLEGPDWMRRIWSVYKDKEKMKHHRSLVDRVYTVVTGYINGQLTVSGIGALVAGSFVFIISLFVASVDANLAMPTILITFLLSLIPMFGATAAGVIITLLIMMNSVGAGIVYAIFFIVYQQIENNFISPVIQAKKVELSALAVLVSVTIGIYVGGLIGGVIAMPVAGTVKVFLEDYLERSKKRQAEEEKPAIAKLIKKISGDKS